MTGEIQEIGYGTRRIRWEPGDGATWVWVAPDERPPDAAAADLIRGALRAPLGGPPLRELARGRTGAVILVPGRDRVAAVDACMPPLLEELNAAGIPDEAIEVVLATGTHAHHTAEDAAAILGAEAAGRLRWRQHDPRPGDHLRHVGVTSRGTPVDLDRRAIEAGVTVLTGRVIPHYFAGFGGGRKALLPGVAGLRTILANHRLTLDAGGRVHPAVRPCRLDGNPVHLDMLEAAGRVPGTFVLNTLLDTAHRVVGAVAGEPAAAHAAGCAEARRRLQVAAPGPVDALVAGAGGWPYDADFVQALKAVFNTRDLVRPGGAILWIAQCPQGMKEGFMRWAGMDDLPALRRAVAADYNLAGHNTIMLRELRERARIALWSDLPEDQARGWGLHPVHSLGEGLDWLRSALPRPFRGAVVPFANVTHAVPAGELSAP